MLAVCGSATPHRTAHPGLPLHTACVTREVHRHIVSFATPKPAPTSQLAQHMPCTCGLAIRVRAAYFLAPVNMCARQKPPARLQPFPSTHTRTPPPTSRIPKIPSPHSRPGTHSDRSLIHIFLLGADFSSRGNGQSDSSISGGLRGDSSMLTQPLSMEQREETAPRLNLRL